MDDLLKNATCVLSPQLAKQFSPVVFWLTDSQLLLQERLSKSRFLIRTAVLQIPNKKLTFQKPLTHGFDGVLSPDKKWVLYHPRPNWDIESLRELEAVSLIGKPNRHWIIEKNQPGQTWEPGWDYYKDSGALWLPGGKSWVVPASDRSSRKTTICALTGTWSGKSYINVIPLGLPDDGVESHNSTTPGFFNDTAPLLHFLSSPDGDLIIGIHLIHNWKTKTATLKRFEFRLSKGKSSVKEYPFITPFPAGQIVREIAYSSVSQRLAVLTVTYDGSNFCFLHTLKTDGSQRVCLGQLDYQNVVDPTIFYRSLQWLPSGKSLSLHHNHRLWVLPDAPPQQPQLI